MIEHKLIERMVKLLGNELRKIEEVARVDTDLLLTGVDFFRMYADRTHHGKEEDILFKQLSARPLANDHRQTMERLIREHVFMREVVQRLSAARDRHIRGDADVLAEIVYEIDRLVTLYPLHIRTEDKQFFGPAMSYFSETEQSAMLEEFWEFDRKLIHEKYTRIVEEREKAMSYHEGRG